VQCPCSLLTLRHHNQFVYDDDDNDDDEIALSVLKVWAFPTHGFVMFPMLTGVGGILSLLFVCLFVCVSVRDTSPPKLLKRFG